MAEHRYYDYGKPANAQDNITCTSCLFEAGVLFGNELSVSADGVYLEIAPGAVVSGNGVVINNDAQRTLQFALQSDPDVFTIVQYHTFALQSGGQGSSYALVPLLGYLTEVVGGTVLGWITYPGGSADLTSAMLSRAKALRVSRGSATDNVINCPAPLTTAPGVLVVLETDVEAAHALSADDYPATTWSNTSGSVSRKVTLHMQETLTAQYRPSMVTLLGVTIGEDCSITVKANVEGTTTTIETILAADVVSSTLQIHIPPGTAFTLDGQRYSIIVELTLAPLADATIERILVVASDNPQL